MQLEITLLKSLDKVSYQRTKRQFFKNSDSILTQITFMEEYFVVKNFENLETRKFR